MSGRRYHGDGISGIRIAAYQIFIEKMELNLSRDFNPSSLPLDPGFQIHNFDSPKTEEEKAKEIVDKYL